MCKQILNFYLTEHAMYRGWDRSIDNQVLYKVLPFVNAVEEDKKLVVVTPSFLASKKISGKAGHCLVLVLKQKLIKTGYWCKDPNYLFNTEKQAAFQWLYM